MHPEPMQIYEFGAFRLDTGSRLLTRNGDQVALPPKAFDFLVMVVRNRGRVVLKDEIMQALWPDTFVEEQNLKQTVFLLRKALGENAHDPCYIASVHGKGYRFLPRVLETRASMPEGRSALLSSDIRLTDIRSRQFGFVALIFLLIFLAYLAFMHFGIRPSDRQHREAAARSLAVVDIHNLSASRDDDWLSTAIEEMLTTEMGVGEQLRTLTGEDVAHFEFSSPRAMSLNDILPRIHNTLGVDFIVNGDYAVVGSAQDRMLRIDLRLQDVVKGENIAAISETGRVDDLFALISHAGRRFREKLAIGELSPNEFTSVKSSLPTNEEAVKLYAEALGELRAFEPLSARGLLERVVVLEPTYSQAHSALSEAWEMLGYQDRARDEAQRAFELAINLPSADRLWMQAHFYETAKEWDKAIDIYTELFRSHPDNLGYGLRLAQADISAGRANDALKVVESLHKLPRPAREDARIDLTTAAAAQALFDISTAKTAATRAAEKGKASGARLIVAQAEYSEAEAASDLQNTKEALTDYEQAKQLYAAVGDKAGVCDALVGTGNIVQGQDPALAKTIFSRVLDIAREIGYQRTVARALLDLANVSYDDGELQKAKALYERGFLTYREINDSPGMAGLLLNVGLTLDELGDYQSAEAKLQQSLSIATASKLNFDIADAYNTLGAVLYHEGKLSESLQAYNNSLNTARAIHLKDAIVDSLAGIGRVMRARHELGSAREKQKEALMLQEDALAPRLELARIELDEGNPAGAEETVRKALPKRPRDKTPDSLTPYTILAEALLAQGKRGAAEYSLKRAEALGMRKSPFLDARLEFAITSAHLQAALGHETHASAMLKAAIADARNCGDVPYQLEACNSLVAIDEGKIPFLTGRSCLQVLQEHASAGFVLFAQKAAR
jgi:DNA-binding winged helix-turn-helix (wHTH) protein/tetratricopeptide (TPR) repeat protein